MENAKGCHCLYGLAQTHLVGKKHRGLSEKAVDARLLIRK
jgi:hypothetical protein